jgi:hypothetical protein
MAVGFKLKNANDGRSDCIPLWVAGFRNLYESFRWTENYAL